MELGALLGDARGRVASMDYSELKGTVLHMYSTL